jgi:hypothetical protein
MRLSLPWMPPHAPYMPVATAGLLALLDEAGCEATAHWSSVAEALVLETDTAVERVAELIADAPWPSAERIAWPNGKWQQGLKPTLSRASDPPAAFREMVEKAPALERRLLHAILTDGLIGEDGMPGRSRLLRGVKADLSSVFKPPKAIKADTLLAELRDGPDFRSGSSGHGLGLVPEVQTFGGTTGPEASSVGAYSPLLYLLLWHGIMALPPVAIRAGRRRVVGGPLVTGADMLSWPCWRIPVDLRSLRVLFGLGEIHDKEPDRAMLRERGIQAVYRARAVKLSTTVAVFRWGEQVTG